MYVAATRGRDENLLCVVYRLRRRRRARDTLETILAFDRADIPAVTQRRTLADQQPAEARRQPTAPAVAATFRSGSNHSASELRGELTIAEEAATDARSSGLVLRPRPPRANVTLARVEARPGRLVSSCLRHGTGDRARWQLTDAQSRLDSTGGAATAARHEAAATEVRHERVVEHFQRSGTAPDRKLTSTTRREHASTRANGRSIATTLGFGSAALSSRSRTCDDRSTGSSCGVDGRAATPSTSSNSATPSPSSPATVAGTITPTSFEHSAKRPTIGPTTLASTCRLGGATPEPSNEPAPNLDNDGGQRVVVRVVLIGGKLGAGSAIAPNTADRQETGLPDALTGTNLAWGGIRSAEHSTRIRRLTRTTDEADSGCGAEGV